MALIGLILVGVVFAAGILWLVNNITISDNRSYKYERYTNEKGETLEKVIETTKENK